jgi:hypothetical protein
MRYNGCLCNFAQAFNGEQQAERERFSFTKNKSPEAYLKENLKEGEISTAFKVKVGGDGFGTDVNLEDGSQAFEFKLKNGPTVSFNDQGEVELAATLGVEIESGNNKYGGGAKIFADTTGNVGAGVSVSTGTYEVGAQATYPIFHNAYVSTIAFFEGLYRSGDPIYNGN